jgi:8-hydroxy-5-deazaflavin:NADPH oxidoreductase
MKIGIIGTGNIGGALARLWMAHGHEIVLGVRDEEKLAAVQGSFPGAEVALTEDAAAGAEVVTIALPWPAVEPVLAGIESLAGKLLIDTNNPLKADLSGLEGLGGKSAAEVIQELHPEARVVKAFNTLGAAYLGHARVDDADAGGFYCGDEAGAKAVVAELVEQTGLVPVDCGPLRNARYLEAMAMLWIDMAFGHRRGERFAFALLSDANTRP